MVYTTQNTVLTLSRALRTLRIDEVSLEYAMQHDFTMAGSMMSLTSVRGATCAKFECSVVAAGGANDSLGPHWIIHHRVGLLYYHGPDPLVPGRTGYRSEIVQDVRLIREDMHQLANDLVPIEESLSKHTHKDFYD